MSHIVIMFIVYTYIKICANINLITCMDNETTYQAVLGRLIVQKRQEKEIDQEEMAKHVGVSRSTWSRIEAGSSALNMDKLAKVASKLETPLTELMRETESVVEQLKDQNVKVHEGRDQVSSKRGKLAPVVFLGGAVLGGIVATLLATSNEDKDQNNDEGEN